MIRNIIFDWSGTLVDDLPAVWQATNFVLTQAGLAELSLQQFRREFCLPFHGFYDRHLPHVPMEQLEAWFHDRFRAVQDSVEPLTHAREFLAFCRARDLRTFLLSAVHRDHFAVQAAATGFREFIGHPYVGVWDKRAKIHEILDTHNLSPRETLFVGDMQHDIDTAKHGGILSCAVLTGYHSVEQLRASEPDLIVEHLGELQQLLEQHHLAIPGGQAPQQPIVTVGALIFNSLGEVLMIRTHKWSNLWGIPGGKIKFGEGSLDAVRRELKEETNLDVTDIEFALVQDCIHSKEFYRDAHFVLLNYTCCARNAEGVILNDEANDYCWVRPDAALKMDLNQPTRRLLEAVLARSRA
ncbi:MAG: NUDIX domain-containing protein [Verrucomicrobia subdivision 3 bacterium]|nr:NUDIX domain-containing protein [Limisphaerales bacterium]